MASFPGQKGTGAPLPNPVANVVATPVSATEVDLTWTAVPFATSYKITRNAVLIAQPATNTFNDTGLSAATLYVYQVFAVNANGTGLPSLPVNALTFPGQTQGLVATPVSSSQINLNWTATAGATNYTVRRDGSGVGTPAGTTFSDTGLAASTLYTYTVAANNASGQGVQSAPASATTQASSIHAITINPGFYGDANTVIAGSDDPITRVGFEMSLVVNTPGCLGYWVFMTWGALETSQGVYATAKLDAIYNYLTTQGPTPKRMGLIPEVGAFTSTHPGATDFSTLPQYLQQNVGLYGQAGYRVAGVTTQPTNVSGWWGGDGNGNTYCAQLHRTNVMNRYIALCQAIIAWAENKPFFELLMHGENSLWIGANSSNGGGSGYSDSAATTTQNALMAACAAARTKTDIVFTNTYMQTVTPAQNLETNVVNNACTPGQTDSMGLTRINNGGGILTSWGVSAYAGQLLAGSTATVTNWRDNGVHLTSEIQAPDLGAFGGIPGGTAAQVPVTFSAPALTGATSAVIVSPSSWPNGIGYVVRFSNNTTRSCTVANNHTLTWTPGLSSDCTNAGTVLEGGANGWTPQDLCDAHNIAYKSNRIALAVIPDSATYVPIDRRWSQASAVFIANYLPQLTYPVNLP